MREFKIYAPAKLNLYLDVLDKRSDGFHNIETLFEKIDLKDEIIIREKQVEGVRVKVVCSSQCPQGRDNIVYKAIQALFKETKVNLGLDITIKKNIPIAAGLGGGSSDAAYTLRSVNEIFKLGISKECLFSIGALVGKDVPFFISDASFAIGTGTGEILEEVKEDFSLYHVIVKPKISISTAEMYNRLDGHNRLSKKADVNKVIYGVRNKDVNLLKENFYNVFEEVLADYSPYIEKAKVLLQKAGAEKAFLSGSGPTVFCMLKDKKEAMNIFKAIPKREDMEIFVATTCNGGQLWK